MSEFRSIGDTPKKKMPKNTLLIGGGLAVLVVVYMYRKNKAATTATPSADQTIDPATGQPYTSEQGFGGFLGGVSGTTPGSYGFYNPSSGQFIGGTGSQVAQLPGTHQQWFIAAESYLTGASGSGLTYDPVTVGTALARYLAGQQLTDNQMQIVQTAIAAEGDPPPPAVPAPHVAPPAGQSGSGGTTGRTPAQLANSARLLAVYQNIVAHRKAAEAQYKLAPNASNLRLLQNYQREEKVAFDAYHASLV